MGIMAAHPGEIMLAKGRAGDDLEAVSRQPRDGQVAFNAAALVGASAYR